MDGYQSYMNSPVGMLRITDNGEAVTEIQLLHPEELPQNDGQESAIGRQARQQLEEYFAQKRTQFDLPLQLNGTEFQKKVWKALCDIPYGETRSYQDIAIAVENPKGSRAIGMANHNNPIMIVVPCHRVIGKNGKLVGYGGGLPVKETLLALEAKGRNPG